MSRSFDSERLWHAVEQVSVSGMKLRATMQEYLDDIMKLYNYHQRGKQRVGYQSLGDKVHIIDGKSRDQQLSMIS